MKEIKKYRKTLKEEGFKAVLKQGGWKLLLIVILYYLIRDSILYILLPILIAKNVTKESYTMMTGVLHAHSIFRYVLLALILISILVAIKSRKDNELGASALTKLTVWTTVFAHIQLVLGFILYFGNNWAKLWSNMAETMKEASLRFFMVEHAIGMLIAVVLLTIGRAKLKRQIEGTAKAKKIIWFYSIALIVIFLSIPWPWMPAARPFLPF